MFPLLLTPGRRRHGQVALACAGWLALAAQAAPLQDQTDPLQRPDATAAAGKTLDRALSVDGHAGQRNLDLLLETRSADDAPADPVARRAAALQPPVAASGGIGALPTAGQAGQAGSGAPDAVAPPGLAPQREWLGAMPGHADGNPGLLAMPGQTTADVADLALQRGGNPDALELDPALRGAFVRDTVAFVREHRLWLLLALAAAVAAAAGVQAWLRRGGGDPQRRAERLNAQRSLHGSEQRGAHRSRRRSSRRA